MSTKLAQDANIRGEIVPNRVRVKSPASSGSTQPVPGGFPNFLSERKYPTNTRATSLCRHARKSCRPPPPRLFRASDSQDDGNGILRCCDKSGLQNQDRFLWKIRDWLTVSTMDASGFWFALTFYLNCLCFQHLETFKTNPHGFC